MADPLFSLALILLAAEAGGFVSGRLGLTRIVGQIAAGLLIGPSVFGLVTPGATIDLLSGVGALCILSIAGLETDLRAIRSVGRPALLAAIGGVAIPMVTGVFVVQALGYDLRAALFCGAILTATSVGVTAAALRELGRLDSRVGSTILAAAVIDDVLGLMVLAVVSAEMGGARSPIVAIGAMALVLGAAVIVIRVGRTPVARTLQHLHFHGGGLAAMLGLVLLVAWVFQAIGGLAGISGAYAAGLLVAGSPLAEKFRDRLVHAGEAILVPVFFVGVGLSTDLRAVPAVLPVAILLLIVAALGKLVGSGLMAWLGGLDRRSSAGVGIGMIARGEVALVALAVARSAGALDGAMFAALVLVILATTVLTPIGLSLWAGRIGLPEIVRGTLPGARAPGPLAPGSLAPAYQRPAPARQLDVR